MSEKIPTAAELLGYGKHWNGSVVFDGRPPNRRTEYVPRHADNGNCHHWWPETRFAPPTMQVNFDGWGRTLANPRTVIDDSKPAPYADSLARTVDCAVAEGI